MFKIYYIDSVTEFEYTHIANENDLEMALMIILTKPSVEGNKRIVTRIELV